ncbi:hypothetical protein N5E16_04080 [Stutzerimonas stutzeri]|nr:hypothetical protein [Stutzerimonas stutzeri]MDH1669445.1 hypothetical protein [Stutzerimonas stutzeri]
MSDAALGRLAHAGHQAFAACGIGAAVEHVEPAGNHHQQVVEVMGDAAGELADGLDFLRLAQGLLDTGAFGHLRAQFLVGLFQLAGPFDHQRFELVRGAFARFEQRAHLVLAMPPAQRRLHGTGEGDALHRTFQQRDVAQRGDHALAPGGHGRLLMLAGEHHEGKIGPGRLSVDPGGQSREVMAEQAFLGDEYGVGFRFRALEHFLEAVADHGFHAAAVEQLGRGGAVPTDGGKDDYGGAVTFSRCRHARLSVAEPHRRCIPVCPKGCR